MKKFATLSLLVVLLLVTATSALAQEPQPPARQRGRGPFALAGTITAIDGATVTVKVVGGNRMVKEYLGKDLAIQTTEATRFLLKNADGTVTPITLAELTVGQNVSVMGRVAENVFVARRITVGARLVHLP